VFGQSPVVEGAPEFVREGMQGAVPDVRIREVLHEMQEMQQALLFQVGVGYGKCLLLN